MENKETEYKSGIVGKANVWFGGKVAVASGMTTPFHLPAISFAELYETGEPGRKLSDADKEHEPQVWLTFNDMRSIDIVQRHLDRCRELLKRMDEQQPKPEPTGIFAEKVEDHKFSRRTLNFFRANGIKTVADMVRLNKTDMLKWRQFGKKSLTEVDDFIESHGLQWGMNV